MLYEYGAPGMENEKWANMAGWLAGSYLHILAIIVVRLKSV